jgi:hypothetical protein
MPEREKTIQQTSTTTAHGARGEQTRTNTNTNNPLISSPQLLKRNSDYNLAQKQMQKSAGLVDQDITQEYWNLGRKGDIFSDPSGHSGGVGLSYLDGDIALG